MKRLIPIGALFCCLLLFGFWGNRLANLSSRTDFDGNSSCRRGARSQLCASYVLRMAKENLNLSIFPVLIAEEVSIMRTLRARITSFGSTKVVQA